LGLISTGSLLAPIFSIYLLHVENLDTMLVGLASNHHVVLVPANLSPDGWH
jgi:hypothetical protein